MIQLTAVIITFNEERNIERCLLSIKNLVDEIIVLDSGSTDLTQDICRRYNVKLYIHPFDGFIKQKNRALAYSTHPYVLSLDADEAIDQTLAASILNIKKNFNKDGYYMNRLTNYCGRWIRYCGWYPDKKLRIFDRTKGMWGGTDPHDEFILFAGKKDTAFLRGDILHYSYYSLQDHYKKVAYFTDISSKALFEKGKKAGIFKLFINPAVKFIKSYFIQLGFLDGKAGLQISVIAAYTTYLKYKKLRSHYLHAAKV